MAAVVPTTRLWFCRHGEVEEPWVGRFIGTTDIGLSPLGRHQGEAIAAYLEPAAVDALVCSPRKRALDTLAPLARAKGHKLDVRKDLAEMHFGDWEGKSWEQILAVDADHAKRWEADPANVAPPGGGESANDFAARVARGLEAVKAEYKGRTIVIGAHAGTNRGFLATILGRPYMEMFSFAQDYGCVNAVGWANGGFGQLALVNFVPGPASLRHGAREEEK